MKRTRILAVIFTLALAVCAGVSVTAFADGGARAGETYTVTYSLTAYRDRTETVTGGEKINAPVIGDFYKAAGIGDGGEPASEALAIEWYTDAAHSTAYDSDAPVTSDLHLYGLIKENGSYGKSDAYGWTASSGMIYVGAPSLNQVLSSDNLCRPASVDENGAAFFSFGSNDYSVLHCGFDVTRPFGISVEISDFESFDEQTSVLIYNLSLYASVYEAMAGTVHGHEERGAMSSVRFWLDPAHFGVIHNTGYYAGEPSPRVVWNDTSANLGTPTSEKMKSILENSDGKLTFTFHINDADSYAEINGERILELGCVRANFPGGKAYLSTGTETALEATVSVSQETGSVTAQAKDGRVKKASAVVTGSFITVSATVDKGYDLKATVLGKEAAVEKIGDGEYAVALPYFTSEDFTVELSAVKTGGGNGGGSSCNSSAAAACLPAACVLILAGVATVCVRRKRKGEN